MTTVRVTLLNEQTSEPTSVSVVTLTSSWRSTLSSAINGVVMIAKRLTSGSTSVRTRGAMKHEYVSPSDCATTLCHESMSTASKKTNARPMKSGKLRTMPLPAVDSVLKTSETSDAMAATATASWLATAVRIAASSKPVSSASPSSYSVSKFAHAHVAA